MPLAPRRDSTPSEPDRPAKGRRVFSIALTAEREQEARHQPSAFRSLRTHEAAFVVSPQLRVTSWNDPIERLTGRRARDVVGRPCHEVVASISHAAAPPCCREGCPLVALPSGHVLGPAVPFDLRTPAGAVRAELATIGGEARELMHLVRVLPDDRA